MTYQHILIQNVQRVTTITMNRPERLNALNPQMTQELLTAFAEADNDPEVRVIVLTGAGRAFCSGADLRGREGGETRSEVFSAEQFRQRLRKGLQRLPWIVRHLDKPVIAAVPGMAAGGGFDIASACDIRIASEDAVFCSVFIRRGLFPGTGGTYLLPQVLPLGKAFELLYTGRYMNAEEAERSGYVNKVVPAKDLPDAVQEFAEQIAASAPIAIKLTKLQVYKGLQFDMDTALEVAAAAESITASSEDVAEGRKSFFERRPPAFTGR